VPDQPTLRDRIADALQSLDLAYFSPERANQVADAVLPAPVDRTVRAVRAVIDEIDTEMRTEPDTQRAAMQMEAVIRVRAAFDGHPLRRMADEAQQPEEAHVVADSSDDPEHVDDCPGCPAP
jgi:hypothetical protein